MFGDILKKNYFISKIIDYCTLYFVGLAAVAISPFFLEGIFKIIYILLVPFLWLPIGAFFLHKFGRTPGMSLFGLKAQHNDGVYLSWKEAYRQALLPYPDEKHGIEVRSTISSSRRIITLVVLLLGVTYTSVHKDIYNLSSHFSKSFLASEWVEYSDDDDNFTIHFPTEPSEVDKSLGLPNGGKSLDYTEVSSQKKKATYSLSYIKLPKKWGIAGDNTILKVALDLIVKHTKGAKLAFKKMTTHKAARAIDFIYQEGKDEVQGRLVIVGNKLYKLTIKYPQGYEGKASIDAFINSFEPK